MKTTVLFVIVLSLMCMFLSCKKEPEAAPLTYDELDKELLLNLVNQSRSEGCNCGDVYMEPVQDIVWSDLLETVAKNHSADMNSQDYFDHTSKDGSSPGDRIERSGYQWRTYGENIAIGHSNEEAVITGWLNSPGHCKNIMNESFKEMGIGKSDAYWTQVFATKK